MSTPNHVQIIYGPDGAPAFVVIPYADYVATQPRDAPVPNEVVGYMVKEGLTAVGAWRRHLGFSQAEVAARIGISRAAYAQQEQAKKPRKPTREKIATAFGISPELLDL